MKSGIFPLDKEFKPGEGADQRSSLSINGQASKTKAQSETNTTSPDSVPKADSGKLGAKGRGI